MRPGPVFLFLYEIFLFLSEFLFLYVFVKFFNGIFNSDNCARQQSRNMKKHGCPENVLFFRIRFFTHSVILHAADRCGCRPVRPVESNVFSV